jgi:hypothetical protein
MSAKEAQPNDLMRTIECQIQSDPVKLSHFHALIARFKLDQSDFVEIFNQLRLLFGDDPYLLLNFHPISANPPEKVLSLLKSIDQSLAPRPPLRFKFMTALNLFLNELISIEFFKSQSEELTVGLEKEDRQKIKEQLETLIQHFQAFTEPDFLKHLRIRRLALNPASEKYTLSPSFNPHPLYQFLTMAGIACSTEQIRNILKAFDLYAFELLSMAGVLFWLRSINSTIAQSWEKIAPGLPSGAFFPSLLWKQMKKDTAFTSAQLELFLGKNMYQILSKWPANHRIPLLEIATKAHIEQGMSQGHRLADAVFDAAELQVTQCYQTLKKAALNLQAGVCPVLSEDFVRALYGADFPVLSDDWFVMEFLNDCLEIGKKQYRIQKELQQQKLDALSKSSADWRTFYSKALRKGFVIRGFIFGGFRKDLPEKMELAIGICERFLREFPALFKPFIKLQRLIQTTDVYLNEFEALASVLFSSNRQHNWRSGRCVDQG